MHQAQFPTFPVPSGMHEHIQQLTNGLAKGDCIRNYVGVVENMEETHLVVETELFSAEVLRFYSWHNLCLFNEESNPEDYAKFYNEARGGAQGDYREGLPEKFDNVVRCLSEFPASKRAVLTVPYSSEGSMCADHTRDDQAKCLRELHFYVQDKKLHCSGFMRAQAASIFPKNIHFIGTLMNVIGERLDLQTGSYTHFVTTLVNER